MLTFISALMILELMLLVFYPIMYLTLAESFIRLCFFCLAYGHHKVHDYINAKLLGLYTI